VGSGSILINPIVIGQFAETVLFRFVSVVD
jgi:hypothetical protein